MRPPTGVVEHGTLVKGLPRNLGDLPFSPGKQRAHGPARPEEDLAAPSIRLPEGAERISAVGDGVPGGQETKPQGTEREESERLDGTDEAGERVPSDPAEGSEASEHGDRT